jgi:hypothetical protein
VLTNPLRAPLAQMVAGIGSATERVLEASRTGVEVEAEGYNAAFAQTSTSIGAVSCHAALISRLVVPPPGPLDHWPGPCVAARLTYSSATWTPAGVRVPPAPTDSTARP